MPMIMPKVRRSRLSWMNSLTMIATHRDQEKLIGRSFLFGLHLFHQVDEDVFQPGVRLAPTQLGVVFELGDRALELRFILAGDMQRVAKRRHVGHSRLSPQRLR